MHCATFVQSSGPVLAAAFVVIAAAVVGMTNAVVGRTEVGIERVVVIVIAGVVDEEGFTGAATDGVADGDVVVAPGIV